MPAPDNLYIAPRLLEAMRHDVYSDAYPLAIPPERLEEAIQVFTSCRLRRPPEEIWRCAQDAAAGTFCPCISAAGGGFGANDRVIFQAVAAEIERRMIGRPAPEATSAQTAKGDDAPITEALQEARGPREGHV